MKKIICILICMVFIFQPHTFAEEEKQWILNETFNSYPTNYQETFDVSGCSGYYVCEYENKEKGFYLPLLYKKTSISFKCPADSDFSISFDYEIIGANILGSLILNDSFGNKFVPATFEKNKRISATRGRKIGQYSIHNEHTRLNNICITYKSATKYYEVYYNGKCVVPESISDSQLTGLESITFEAFAVNATGYMLFDNVSVQTGCQYIASRPTSAYNPEVAEPVVPDSSAEGGNKILFYNDFEEQTTVGMDIYSNDNTLEVADEETGNHVLSAVRNDKFPQNFYFNVVYDNYVTFYPKLVYSMDIKLNGSTTADLFYLRDNSSDSISGGCYVIRLSDTTLSAGNAKLKELTLGKWTNVCAAVDYLNRSFDVYIDGELCADDVPFSSAAMDTPSHVRIYVPGSAAANFMTDNILVYEGDKPRVISSEEIMKKTGGSKKSIVSPDMTPATLLEDCDAIDLQTGVTYIGGTKGLINVAPYGYDRKSVPVRAICDKLNIDVLYDAESKDVKIGNNIIYNAERKEFKVNGESTEAEGEIYNVNGKLYVPAKSFLEKGLGKKASYSDAYCDTGLIIFGDKNIKNERSLFDEVNSFARYYRPSAEKIISDFESSGKKNVHPKVFANPDEFEQLNKRAETEPLVKDVIDKTIAEADSEKSSIFSLINAYQLTKDKKYADKTMEVLRGPSYNFYWPSMQYLDCAGTGQVMAMAYDFIYDGISEEDRLYLEGELKRMSIDETIKWYKGQTGSATKFIQCETNWNEVCNGCIGGVALALLDVYPEECAYLIENIILSLEYYFDYAFLHSGASYEGPSYYVYGKSPVWSFLIGMDQILNTNYNLVEIPGFYNSLSYIADMYNNKVVPYTYSDSHEVYPLYYPTYMYFCRKSNQDALTKNYMRTLGIDTIDNATLMSAVRYYGGDTRDINDDFSLPLGGAYKEDSVDVAVFRENWTDENASYAAFKGFTVTPFMSHVHMDHGSFIFDSMGERWVMDLGAENYYALEGTGYGIWEMREGRWRAFRNNALGHSTVLINPESNKPHVQNINAQSRITKFEDGKERGFGVIDMSGALSVGAKSARRGFMITDNRKSLVVRDEIELKATSDVVWSAFTKAEAAVIENGRVKLIQNGKTMLVDVITNAKTDISFEKASRSEDLYPSEDQNEGINKIVVKVNGKGNINITVKLTPSNLVGASDVTEYDKSIDLWSTEAPADSQITTKEFEKISLDGIMFDGKELSGFDKDLYSYSAYVIEGDRIPEVSAITDKNKYDVIAKQAKNLSENAQIVVTDKNDPNNNCAYLIIYKKIPKVAAISGEKSVQIMQVSVSSVPQPVNGPANMIDNNPDTRWSSQGKGQWAVFDFGELKNISKLYMSMYDGHTRQQFFNVSVSEDGTNYTTVFDGASSGKTDKLESYALGNQKARFVKIEYNNTSTGDWNSPKEVVFVE